MRPDLYEDEDEHGTIRDGDHVRVPLMLTDGTRATPTIEERRTHNVPVEMSDAEACDYIQGHKAASGVTALADGSLQRRGYRPACMIPAAMQVRDGVSLVDAERARNAAFQAKVEHDRNAWRRPERTLHLPTPPADASAKVVDYSKVPVRSLTLEDARKARQAAWDEKQERDRNAWKQKQLPDTASMVRTTQPAARSPQRDSREAIENTPLAELRARADAAWNERNKRDANAWRRGPYAANVEQATAELRSADDPRAKAQAAEALRIATVGERGA